MGATRTDSNPASHRSSAAAVVAAAEAVAEWLPPEPRNANRQPPRDQLQLDPDIEVAVKLIEVVVHRVKDELEHWIHGSEAALEACEVVMVGEGFQD
jgi:hypothetical protein